MMEKLKFKGTPGPWEPDYKDGVCLGVKKVYFYKPPKVIVDSILPKTLEEYWCQKEDIEANARLIAAAPELLAALENFRMIIECNPYLLESDTFRVAYDYANEVIKKALEE